MGVEMKIIKDGNIDRETKRFTCKKCGCVFEADKDEYRLVTSTAHQYDGIEAVCDCPCCDANVYKYKQE